MSKKGKYTRVAKTLDISRRTKFEAVQKNGSQNTTHRISLTALTDEQKVALKHIDSSTITFLFGPAGTGKSHLATVYGVIEFLRGKYERLIFTRPCIEAYGEKLGSLPGDPNEKIAPYMIPLFDILRRVMDQSKINGLIEQHKIITMPLAFQKGVTFYKAFVVADEMQNSLKSQMRMMLTRIGEDSKIVVTGDIQQSDIYTVEKNGLSDAIERFKDIENESISVVGLTSASIIRHPIIKIIEEKYSEN